MLLITSTKNYCVIYSTKRQFYCWIIYVSDGFCFTYQFCVRVYVRHEILRLMHFYPYKKFWKNSKTEANKGSTKGE